ncbi:prefoldin, beta subunit, archaeal [Methanomethylovorans hollandica DSM 15978]|jgi:prefoldin beta subunit|uniref:Prefoldin subunit beta n=1 Tax=Methanomethylovorans hollandica (strain DSM 15978 / NBRC 107637 / DMS1) TaxID=867904 RepID=L0L0Z4_METHD|nr:prefoldin subunit beta [Methanomethylovorans hollandica]AGB50068.1 prefoldin, beta subunit, archaeal [Methanomethylovorans hollandica DSM 15978]
MSTQIPPQVQNQIAQLQQVQQQAQSLSIQKSQMETLQKESELALEELEKLPDDAIIYRAVGDLQIRSEKQETVLKLKEKIETLSLRVQSISRQEERISKRFSQLQEQIQQAMGQQAQ